MDSSYLKHMSLINTENNNYNLKLITCIID